MLHVLIVFFISVAAWRWFHGILSLFLPAQTATITRLVVLLSGSMDMSANEKKKKIVKRSQALMLSDWKRQTFRLQKLLIGASDPPAGSGWFGAEEFWRMFGSLELFMNPAACPNDTEEFSLPPTSVYCADRTGKSSCFILSWWCGEASPNSACAGHSGVIALWQNSSNPNRRLESRLFTQECTPVLLPQSCKVLPCDLVSESNQRFERWRNWIGSKGLQSQLHPFPLRVKVFLFLQLCLQTEADFLAVWRPTGKKQKTAAARGKGVGGVCFTPSFYLERVGRGFVVAPGYLEEGLLHSEAGQQNWWAMSSSSSSLRGRSANKRGRRGGGIKVEERGSSETVKRSRRLLAVSQSATRCQCLHISAGVQQLRWSSAP